MQGQRYSSSPATFNPAASLNALPKPPTVEEGWLPAGVKEKSYVLLLFLAVVLGYGLMDTFFL